MAVPAGLTTDGYEIQFGTNHMGHAAILKLVLPLMLRTAEQPSSDVRFVSVTSQGYGGHPRGGIVFDELRSAGADSFISGWVLYGQSKLANILLAREVARRHPAILTTAIHPGVVKTELVTGLRPAHRALVYATNPFSILQPEEGAYNCLWAATAPRDGIESGKYYEPVGAKKSGIRKFNDDGTLAAKLWEWTKEELKDFGN